MKSCSRYHKILWKDIYGELTPEDRVLWEQHRKVCKNCFQEYKKLLCFMDNVKKAAPTAQIEPHEARAMAFYIKQKLRKNKKISWLPQWLNIPGMGVPALLTTCLLVLMFTWVGIQGWERNLPVQTVSINSEDQLIIKNFDVINNLELLEEMDAVEKLVQVVDQPEYGSISNKFNLYVKKEINLNEQFA